MGQRRASLKRELVQSWDRIALEDRSVRNRVRNKYLSKSSPDSGWSMFRQFLTYKAESAGREVAFVDLRCTSKTCSNCGAIFEYLTLKDRWVTCACGLSLDRDHNAAINILRRSRWDPPVLPNVGAIEAVRAPVKDCSRSCANLFAVECHMKIEPFQSTVSMRGWR